MALIAISGKKNSGKDLVYNIINYLYVKYKYSNIYKQHFYNFDTYLEYIKQNNEDWQDFKNVKFADKLKDIVCILIGCTREQLEDREFKEKELGEEWRKWYWSYYKATYNSNPKGKISGYFITEEDCQKAKSDFDKILYQSDNWEIKNELLTPRMLLQEIGTDLFRNQLHSEIWVNSVFSNYKKQNYTNNGQPDFDWNNQQNEPKPFYPNWIITDLRFKNELKAIKDRKGITIRINTIWDYNSTDSFLKNINQNEHPSETELDNETFDIILDNNGTIEDLIEQVDIKLFKNNVFRNLLL